jgi:hypothetical protein
MLGCEGKQRQMPCSLDGNCQAALVLGASTRLSSGFDLSPFRKISTQGANVFVINLLALFQTKSAHFAPWSKAPSAPSWRAPAL